MIQNDVLLINTPPYDINNVKFDYMGAKYVFPPMGIMILAERLKRRAHVGKVKCMDYAIMDYSYLRESEFEKNIENEFKSFLRKNDLNPRLIGISVMFSSTYDFFSEIVRMVRKCIPNAVIVVGGTHATSEVDYILKNNEVDYVICGEGEEALVELANAIQKGIEPKIQGIYSKIDTNRRKRKIEKTVCVENIDIDFTIYPKVIDMQEYVERTSLFSLSNQSMQGNAFSIMASRGCPIQCIFCAAHTVHGRKPRWRSISNVKEEMLWLYEKYGVRKFYLMDDNYIPKMKALELFKMLSRIEIPGIDIIIQNMSVNHTDHEIIDAIIKAKIKYLPLAIESGSLQIQKKIKKYCDLDKAIELVSYARKKGLNTRCFYIIGFPEETVKQMEETIDFARKVRADWSSFNVAVPLPGSEMFKRFEELNYFENTPRFWKAATIRDRVFDTKEISALDIKNLAYRANLEVNFLNNVTIQERRYQEAKVIFKNFLRDYHFHIFALDALRRIYLLTGRKEKAEEIVLKIKTLIKNDPKAQSFTQWKSLFEEKEQALYFG